MKRLIRALNRRRLATALIPATTLAAAFVGTIALATPALAQQQAFTGDSVNLRAGPGRDFPLISLIPPHQPTQVFGCVGDYGWCDVAVDGMRGWVAGGKLHVSYGDHYVWLQTYAPRIGVPVIGFDFDTYWGTYYRGRPFFADRDRWRRYAPVYAHPEGEYRPGYDRGYEGRPGYGVPPGYGTRPGYGAPPPPDHGDNRPHPQPGGPGPGLTHHEDEPRDTQRPDTERSNTERTDTQRTDTQRTDTQRTNTQRTDTHAQPEPAAAPAQPRERPQHEAPAAGQAPRPDHTAGASAPAEHPHHDHNKDPQDQPTPPHS